jgi:DNA-binding Xre family transcriptional regulator
MPDHHAAAAGPATPRVYTARGPVAGEDWPGVARALNERMAAQRIGQQELAQRSGVSVSTLRQLQHGASRRVQNRTLAAISTALDWPEDHLTAVLRHGHRPSAASTPSDPDAVLAGLHRIQAQLADLSDRLASIETLLRATSD